MKCLINQIEYEISEQDLSKNLLVFLRDDLNLTGAKNGCNIGVCGSCTILINDHPVRACKKQVQDIVDQNVLTIEGFVGPEGSLHPLQQAFLDAGAIQCGFCTPGMVMAAHAFLLKNNSPTRDEIRKALTGNICRCTGYQQIIDAIEIASKFY